MNNPLLQSFDLPPFEKIQPDQIKPAITDILDQNRSRIRELEKQQTPSWDQLVFPLEQLDNRLSKVWSPVRHLNSVKSSEELREVYNECLPMISEYYTELGQNTALFQFYQTLADGNDFNQLTAAQQKTIKDALIQFRLGGVDLEAEDREQYQLVQKRLSELKTLFENNLLDATESWELVLDDDSRLNGLPDYAKSMLKQYAGQKSLDGYRITLDMPCYIAVITYADDRDLRQQIYRAFVTRASELGVTDTKWDNAKLMIEILQKRQQKAALLGFEDYAQLSLETKMAGSVDEVIGFLHDLAAKSRPAAQKELDELRQFAHDEGFEKELEAWDIAYYSEKLKHRRYQIQEQDLKPYFSDQEVMDGLFRIVEKLFSVKIHSTDKTIDLWHKDVRYYEIDDSNGNTIASFYLDLYAREGKRGGAWMDTCVDRFVKEGLNQIPVAYMTCNLTPPIGDEPALFTHDEVITLFHEFGHGIHHMLTRIDVPEVSGINGVEWDAVELPSQFMENFCWQREALDLFAKHYRTGEPLPQELFDKMIAAKNFQSAMQMCRQLEFSLFDMLLHQQKSITSADQIQAMLDQVRQEVAVLIPPEFNRFQNSFSHIFAGGYAAGYYSYKWAEVLSADAFSRFEKEGIFDPQVGADFLGCILQQGGSRPARESFNCFMGREPEIDALLRHNGIA